MDADAKTTRLAWMDVMRGLLVLSVVVGHATGRYNIFIYQFHMGAFFLVSGYMSQPERKTVFQTFFHRFFSTYLPVLSAFVAFLTVTVILVKTNLYSAFFDDTLPFIGIGSTIQEFIFHGRDYVWWLGATWFILTLFTASMVNRVILRLCGDRYGIAYCALITLLYLLAYHRMNQGHSWLVLTLLAQFYFGLGTLFKRVHLPQLNIPASVVYVICLLVSGVLLWMVSIKFSFTMDWPSLRFNNPLIDALCVLNGTVFIAALAKLLETVPYLSAGLQYCGRNSLSIVLFHFAWFNAGFYALYLLGIVPFDYLRNFTPTASGTIRPGKDYVSEMV